MVLNILIWEKYIDYGRLKTKGSYHVLSKGVTSRVAASYSNVSKDFAIRPSVTYRYTAMIR